MIAVRMDRRLAARVDPSDVVQEALMDAAQKLAEYVQRRPLPFYPWLRQLAWERLLKCHRDHIRAQKRSVGHEEPGDRSLPEESAVLLASGMGATACALLALLRPGDHLLASAWIYGGTQQLFVEEFATFGIDVSLLDPTETRVWRRKMRKETRAIFLETEHALLVAALRDVEDGRARHQLLKLSVYPLQSLLLTR